MIDLSEGSTLSLDFFKESITSYTQKTFSKFTSSPDIIYSPNFDNDFLNPIFVNLISLFHHLIVKNKISKLWSHVAENIINSSNTLIEIFKKEINSKSISKEQGNKSFIKDKDLANINLYKFEILSFCQWICIKGINDSNYYDYNSENMNKILTMLQWLITFCNYKSNEISYVNFIQKFILKIPFLINSIDTKFNVNYIKWIHSVLVKGEFGNEELFNEIKEIIDRETNKNNNAFAKMQQAPKESSSKLSRSRGASFDKADYTNYLSNFDKKEEKKNYKLEKYFQIKQKKEIKEENVFHQKEKEPEKSDKEQEIEESNHSDINKDNSFNEITGSFNKDVNSHNGTISNSFPSFSFGNVTSIPNSNNIMSSFPTINLSNFVNEDNYSQVSSSRLSLSKRSSALDLKSLKHPTSFSCYSTDNYMTDDNLSYTQPYHSSGINSLLKCKTSHSRSCLGYGLPTFKSHNPNKKYKRDYSTTVHYKFANKLALLTKNDENICNNISIKIPTKEDKVKEKMDTIKNFIRKNFYKNTERSRSVSPDFEKMENEKDYSTQAKTNQKIEKEDENESDDVLAYRTPIKQDRFRRNPSTLKGIVSPGTTRKNLLKLFQQVNK